MSGPLLGLLQHPANPGEPLSEFRTGLGHLEFEVAGRDEVDWIELLIQIALAALGVALVAGMYAPGRRRT